MSLSKGRSSSRLSAARRESGIELDPSIHIFEWQLCALSASTTASPAWPDSGSGISWTWDAGSTDPLRGCQKGTNAAVVGYFHLTAYAPGGWMFVTKHPSDHRATITGCQSIEDYLCGAGDTTPPCTGVSYLGSAAFNPTGTGGWGWCGSSAPVRPDTWGTIKATYR
jgi:hypothetical protein